MACIASAILSLLFFPAILILAATAVAFRNLTAIALEFICQSYHYCPAVLMTAFTRVPLLEYLLGYAWRWPSMVVVLCLFLGLTAVVTRGLLAAAGALAVRLGRVPSDIAALGLDIEEFQSVLRVRIENGISTICVATMNLGVIVAVFVPWFWIFVICATSVVTVVWVRTLLEFRKVGIALLYRLRGQLAPYALIVPIVSIAAIVSALFIVRIGLALDFAGDTDLRLMPAESLRYVDMLNVSISLADLAEATAWSVVIASTLIWILPIVIKLDFMSLLACGAAFAVPFLGPDAKTITEWLPINSSHVPIIVVSGIAVIVVSIAMDKVRDLLESTVRCASCRERIARADLYCRHCGQLNREALR